MKGRDRILLMSFLPQKQLMLKISSWFTRYNSFSNCQSLDKTNMKVFIKTIRASNLLSKQDMSILFINWKDLIVTNNKLLKSMRIRQSTNQQKATIGDILCENVMLLLLTLIIKFQIWRYTLVPRHDSLHQVLLLPALLRCLAAEACRSQTRVW